MGNLWAQGCRGKVGHASRRRALAVVRAMRRQAVQDSAALDAYRCRECRLWHVGHASKRPARAPLKTMRAAVGDVVEIVWRRSDGTETRSRHESPQERRPESSEN